MTIKKILPFVLLAALCGCADGSDGGHVKCDPGFVNCNDTCINPLSSSKYCGADVACSQYSVCKPNEFCKHGSCEPTSACDPQTPMKCNDTCIDPMSDRQYCGAKDACAVFETCNEDANCIDGKCVKESCESHGKVTCSNRCVDAMTDHTFCGALEGCTGYLTCKPNEACKTGVCEIDTSPCEDATQVRCAGSCIDPQSSLAYCGAKDGCTDFVVCKSYESCVDGRCQRIGGDLTCPDGQFPCGFSCVNPNTDRSYCGATSCNTTSANKCKGNQICKDGTCILDPNKIDCTTGDAFVYCSEAQKCINPYTDPKFCGAGFECDEYDICAPDQECSKGKCVEARSCIAFKDDTMKKFVLENWDVDEDGCMSAEETDLVSDRDIKASDFQGKEFVTVEDLNHFKNVKTLPDQVFKNCTKLKTAILSNITEIGMNVFEGCSSLETVELNSIEVITDMAFSNCTKLKNASFKKAYSLQNAPFNNCSGLRKLDLSTPDTITFSYSSIFGAGHDDYAEKITLTLNKNKKSEVTTANLGLDNKWQDYVWDDVDYAD